MTFCQQVGWAAMAWGVGRSNDAFGASAAHPAGYVPGILMFAGLGFIGLTCSVLLWRLEHGPGATAWTRSRREHTTDTTDTTDRRRTRRT